MREILSSQYGVVFFPKRQLQIPALADDKVAQILGKKVGGKLIRMSGYLKGEAVGDQWGSNHEERRRWRAGLYKQFGQPFLECYYNSNQFRMNKLAVVKIDMGELVRDAEKNGQTEIAVHLKKIHSRLTRMLNGEDPETGKRISRKYNELEDLDDKIKVVHCFEDNIIEAFGLLS